MNVSPIGSANYYSGNNGSPNFGANLWVSQTVKEVIKPNQKAFVEAAEKCDQWLRKDKGHIFSTMTIRKNTSLIPKVAFERMVQKTTYDYPHEETGYTYWAKVQEYEDLEFELDGRKCGFWFDKNSDVAKLFSDFKNVFNYLSRGK